MAIDNRFKQADISTLAKRAANQCSNPSCNTITSGPTDDPSGSINIGEAAHIYGAHQGSARFDINMSASERSSITNAIWLCGNCHKVIDDDSIKYPAGLLFEWQREHERKISEQLGRSSAEIRQRYEKRHIEEFGRLSYLAERIILEKGDCWEYQLTAEVLRYEVAPIKQRWKALKSGLYVKALTRVGRDTFFNWTQDKCSEMSSIMRAFEGLTNKELVNSWGAPGVAGDDLHIVGTCRLYAELCKSTLEWEESIRFSKVPDECIKLHQLFSGIGDGIFESISKLLSFLNDIIEQKPSAGHFELKLTFSMPDNWSDNVNKALEEAKTALDL